MRVTKLDFPDLPCYGLAAIKADRLGRIVVLAGKNGAGKSRIMDRIRRYADESIHGMGSLFDMASLFRAHAEGAEPFRHIPRSGWWRNDQAWRWFTTNVFSVDEEARAAARTKLYDIEFSGDGKPQIIQFVPVAAPLRDAEKLSRTDLRQKASSAENPGNLLAFPDVTFARIQDLQDQWREATHSHNLGDGSDPRIKQYKDLYALVERFLSTSIGRDDKGRATLFGRILSEGQLSDGQRVLLQFCVAVHAQADKLSESIILLDEPENHLHPGAILDVIEAIDKAIPNGQLWIATHSVPLLANFDSDSIWWVHDGCMKHAGSHPEIVLESLIGGEERLAKLSDFLALPTILAANRFSYQCLLAPEVVPHAVNDPQANQIQKVIQGIRPDEKIRLLDFGAGRGRLLTAMAADVEVQAVTNRFDYIAFDSSADHRTECEAAVGRVYGADQQRCFFDEPTFRSHVHDETQDVVVMCNVLHEIEPADWLGLFSESGLVTRYLHKGGFLLLVEDNEMRVGEKANAKGFLVLDTPALRTLFKIKPHDSDFQFYDERGDGRLKAHLIPADCLWRISSDSLKAALREVKDAALKAIKVTRARVGPANYRDGRRHAFYVQQLANSELALQSLGSLE